MDLVNRRVTLGVGDLLATGVLPVGRVAGLSVWTRLELGREAHRTHQRAQAELHTGYAREITVKYQTTVDDFAVTVQGRLDGVYPAVNGGPTVIEEIKSVVLTPLAFAALDRDSYPHYVEQLRLYCFLVGGQTLGRLVFLNVADGARKDFEIPGPFADCADWLADRVRALIRQAEDNQQRRATRRAAARELNFPFAQPRRHQDEMIAAVRRAVQAGRHLLVSAPAGIGKTAGALFPVMQAAAAEGRQVFFVTAKNTQHAQALETVRRLAGLTAVAWRAREKMCINNVYACREEFCPHLQMFALKLERTKVLERLKPVTTADELIEAGRGVSLCPFELALLQAERADGIVCDYNYVFDPQVYLRRFFQDEDYSDAILIVDEAHNLADRARDYYSPRFPRRLLRQLTAQVPAMEPALARDFRHLIRRLNEFFETVGGQVGDEYSQVEAPTGPQFLIESPRPFFEELRPTVSKLAVRYLLDKLTRGRQVAEDPVEEFFAVVGQFSAALAWEGEEFDYVFDRSGGESVRVVCHDASRMLAERMAGFHSVIAMSATLEPAEFYRQMLGLPSDRTDVVSLPSPFPVENRLVRIVPTVSTTYSRRGGSYDKIAAIIETVTAARPGNYMALFPSYDFLRAVAARLPGAICQTPQMDDAARAAVLTALQSAAPPKLVLAVQGGVFAEGVDYPGEVLSGVIVVSPALPQVTFERERMRRYYDQRGGNGFEYAYLYPGMNRVIQSVGRLIRSETDRGVAVLVCQRFAQDPYAALVPADWHSAVTRNLAADLAQFWSRHAPAPLPSP